MNFIIWIRNLILLTLMGLGVMVGCSPVGFDAQSKLSCEQLLARGEVETCDAVEITPSSTLVRRGSTVSIDQAKVDILFVVDNSSSMLTEQQRMGNAFNNFISSLNGLNIDWQVGVTTMDVGKSTRQALNENPTLTYGSSYYQSYFQDNEDEGLMDGNLLKFNNGFDILRKNTPNADSLFKDRVQITNLGTYDERGFLTAIMAMSKANGSLFRPSSKHTALIFLSDEDIRSYGEDRGFDVNGDNNCVAGQGGVQPGGMYFCLKKQDTKEGLISFWEDTVNANKNKTLSAHSIIIKPGNASCLNSQRGQALDTAEYGRMYQDISNDPRSKGIVGNICSSSYSNELSSMGNFIASRSLKEVVIPVSNSCVLITDPQDLPDNVQNPNLDVSLKITVTINSNTYQWNFGDAIPAGLNRSVSLNGNVLEFNPALPAGSSVTTSHAELCGT